MPQIARRGAGAAFSADDGSKGSKEVVVNKFVLLLGMHFD